MFATALTIMFLTDYKTLPWETLMPSDREGILKGTVHDSPQDWGTLQSTEQPLSKSLGRWVRPPVSKSYGIQLLTFPSRLSNSDVLYTLQSESKAMCRCSSRSCVFSSNGRQSGTSLPPKKFIRAISPVHPTALSSRTTKTWKHSKLMNFQNILLWCLR